LELFDLLAVLFMGPLLEERLHRGGGQVAAADEPLVSLMDGRDVKGAARFFSISRRPPR
jgi:hypothetical protein